MHEWLMHYFSVLYDTGIRKGVDDRRCSSCKMKWPIVRRLSTRAAGNPSHAMPVRQQH